MVVLRDVVGLLHRRQEDLQHVAVHEDVVVAGSPRREDVLVRRVVVDVQADLVVA